MKTFKQYTEACWTGYTAKGMKKKGNRMVPNCVPEETELKESHKVGDSVTVNSKFFGKQKGKVVKVDNQSVHVQRDGKKYSEKYPHDSVIKEDGMGGAVSAGPTNVVSSGAIAGSGGKGGEPGVSKKRNPVMKPMARRNLPQ